MCIKVSGMLSQNEIHAQVKQALKKEDRIRVRDETEYIVFSKTQPANG